MVQALDDCDVGQDLPQAMQLLGEMNNHVKQVSDLVENMLQKVKSGEMSTEYGLSFLEIKYHMLLTYLINLTYVVLRKCSGQTIENDPSIDRLIEIRTVLEKIRPIDHKLRYQIDKLVKTAQNTPASGTLRANLGLAATPLPEESAQTHESEDSDDEAEEESNRKRPTKAGSSAGLYVPPKHMPMYYEEDESKAERSRKQLERAKKRSIGMSIIEDLKEEYLDTPVEISGTSKAQQMFSRAQKEKEEFEETYLTRLPVTKAEKHRQRRLTTLGTLGDELTRFGDADGAGSSKKSGKRKRRGAPKKKGGKKRKIK
ncbi:neuroguidin [Phlebotomus argentipes]|uniref:neuroguidin n=1 Tax=Phlebotomus argentipes TaxID=94469 RepID=UPI002892E3B1|nr:neuroguidin [Phlebotomus argentipes]